MTAPKGGAADWTDERGTSEEGRRRVQPPGGAKQAEFQQEVRAAVRYEKGLVVKALIALALVALVVLARLLYLA